MDATLVAINSQHCFEIGYPFHAVVWYWEMLSKPVKRLATCKPSSETQGQSVGSGEKAGRKFSLRAKELLGTDSHQTISKNSK